MRIENSIENVRRNLLKYENIEYESLYESFDHKKLIIIFSTLHHLITRNFNLMNSRLPTKNDTNHFWAEESRELILAIDSVRGLERALKTSRYSFSIDKYYDDILKRADSFLSSSQGSVIPKHMERVELYYEIPIFTSLDTVNIKSSHHERISFKEQIGGGSYASVYKFYDSYYDKIFAVKTANNNLNNDELERFKIEFKTLKTKFKSPYIVEVYRYIKENNEYIMELMDTDLYKYVLKENNNELSKTHRINISRQILKGMEHIHSKKLFHRDISPRNILLNVYDDDIIVAKVADFGWVKDLENDMTNLGTAIKGAFNDITDLERVGFDNYSIEHETFALTKLIAFILTGKVNTSKIKNKKIKQFVDKGTSANMEDRFKSVQDIYNHLSVL